MNFPSDLRYTKNHEWIKFLDKGSALVGITSFAQQELGDIVYVDIDTIGNELKAGSVFGTIEAIKTVSDLILPIDGIITEKNEEIDNMPELINQSPYEKGWIIKLSFSKDGNEDFSQLLSHEAYAQICG